jgi:hypothetical protein
MDQRTGCFIAYVATRLEIGADNPWPNEVWSQEAEAA